MKKVLFFLPVMLLISGLSFGEKADNEIKETDKYESRIITLLNEPEIGGIAEFKIRAECFSKKEEMEIRCDIPKNWEVINEQSYQVLERPFRRSPYPEIEYIKVKLWKGHMEIGEVKEILFKARIPDGKKYGIFANGGYDDELFELDLGQPEPPDPDSPSFQQCLRWGRTRLYEIIEESYPFHPGQTFTKEKEFSFKEGETPPILTELQTRTKHIPYIDCVIKSEEVPLRYLVYIDIEAKEVTVTVKIPREDLELVNEENYQVTKTEELINVTLYHGPMKAKESKAFYFKVRATGRKNEYTTNIAGKVEILAVNGRKFYTFDSSGGYFYINYN